eukprot:6143077-Prymnesium_polylepis.1
MVSWASTLTAPGLQPEQPSQHIQVHLVTKVEVPADAIHVNRQLLCDATFASDLSQEPCHFSLRLAERHCTERRRA